MNIILLARQDLPAGSERIEWSGVYFFAFCGGRTDNGGWGGLLELLLKFKMCIICRLMKSFLFLASNIFWMSIS